MTALLPAAVPCRGFHQLELPHPWTSLNSACVSTTLRLRRLSCPHTSTHSASTQRTPFSTHADPGTNSAFPTQRRALHNAATDVRPLASTPPPRPATRLDRSPAAITPSALTVSTAVAELWHPISGTAGRRAKREHVWPVWQLLERPDRPVRRPVWPVCFQAWAGVLGTQCKCLPRGIEMARRSGRHVPKQSWGPGSEKS